MLEASCSQLNNDQLKFFLRVAFQIEVTEKLNSRQFPLRKFSSNDLALMQDIPVNLRESSEAFELVDKSHSVKALGVRWYLLSDVFVFESSLQKFKTNGQSENFQAKNSRSMIH